MGKLLVLTKAQADQVKGRHGKYSEIAPVPLPDGNFMISENCLTDEDLVDVKDVLSSFSAEVFELPDLPTVSKLCEAGKLYKYINFDKPELGNTVKCVQTHNRTIYPPEQTPALFSFFRENSDTLEWIMNEWVELGWKRVYGGKTYEVIQAHQTLETWTPDVTPALWKEVIVVVDIPVWVQPTGAHDAYQTGDKCHFPTINDPIYESLIDANVWSPSVLPSAWKLV